MTTALITLTISRTELSLPVLTMTSARTHTLTITSLTEPSFTRENTYAANSTDRPGSVLLASRYAHASLAFTVGPPDAETEAEARTAIDALIDALAQGAYTATLTIGNAPAQTWHCDPGTLEPTGPRTYATLRRPQPTWNATIPVHPVPS